MVSWECPTNPREASGLDPEAVHEIDGELSVEAARITDEIGPQGPYLDGVDALIAAVARELDAPVVSADGDLTHEATKTVIDIEEYRS